MQSTDPLQQPFSARGASDNTRNHAHLFDLFTIGVRLCESAYDVSYS